MLDALMEPIQVGPFHLRNRVMMTTHNPKLTEQRYLDYLEERAATGLALIGIPVLSETISGLSFADSNRIDPAYSSDQDAAPDASTELGADFYDKQLIPRLRSRADIVHRHGAICFGQVADRGAVRVPETFQPRIAPSTVVDDYVRAIPHELTSDEIRQVIRNSGRSARRIQRAGLDGVEIHGTHGYLVEQFLSPFTNRRKDEYGGSFEGRFLFLKQMIDEVRRVCGADFPIGFRMSASQDVPGGLDRELILRIAERVSEDVIYINVTAGTFTGRQRVPTPAYVATWHIKPGFNAEVAALIREVSKVPVILTGRLNDPQLMNAVIAGGQADMVGITRALMADPELLFKIKTGSTDRVRKCIAANECHYHDRAVGCAVNGRVGHERELKIEKASSVKKVLVVGGGPAGLEVARVTALRGHHVQLWERENVIGGTLGVVASDPTRKEFREYLSYLKRQTADVGVALVTEVEATQSRIREFAPDAIVFATGSRDVRTFRGGPVPTMTATEMYRATNLPEGRILVIGALDDHLAPPMTAEFLADRGKEVLLLTECHIVGQSLEAAVLNAVTRRLLERSVTIMTLTELIGIDPVPRVRNIFNRREELLRDIALVVFAGDRKAEDALAQACRGLAAEIYLIGDCLAPRRLVHATLDAVRTGVRI